MVDSKGTKSDVICLPPGKTGNPLCIQDGKQCSRVNLSQFLLKAASITSSFSLNGKKKTPLLEQHSRRCRLLNVVVSVVGLTAGVVAIPFDEQNRWSTPPSLQKEMTGRDSILTTETWQVIQVYSANRTKSKLSLLKKQETQLNKQIVHSTSCKGIRIPEPGKFLLKKSGIPSFGIQNTAHGIYNTTNDWNPESKLHWQRIRNPVPGIRNQRCGIQNPRLSWIPLLEAK